MKNQSVLPRWSTLLCLTAFAAFLYCSYGAIAAEGPPKIPAQRADIVLLESTETQEAEFPPAVFPHDLHDKALQAPGNYCGSCHTEEVNGKQTFSFMDSAKTDAADLKDYYHDSCISCHEDRLAKGQSTGPIKAECRSCHTATPPSNAGWSEVPFGKVIHNQHINATEAIPLDSVTNTNCNACHETYDENMKRVEYVPGTEESCRSCHYTDAEFATAAAKQAEKEAAAQKAGLEIPAIDDYKLATGLTLGEISHRSCVSCHMELNAKRPADKSEWVSSTISAPTSCAGCHGEAMVSMLKKVNSYKPAVDSRPRLMRGQPDSVIMQPKSDKNIVSEGGMGLVSFDHKLHEEVTPDCRTCHHQEISACSSCHTLEGNDKTNYASIAHVMHKEDTTRSCIGCHNEVKKQPECAGCHVVMPRESMVESACATCHNTPVRSSSGPTESLTAKSAAEFADGSAEALTKKALETTKNRQLTYAGIVSFDDVPETITIGHLQKENAAAEMPHRAIVKKLAEGVADSRLAMSFHTVDTALCMGCHHHSPASITPPKCVSCHSIEPGLSTVDALPELKAAYHQQCIGCHTAMEQQPSASECADCHKPVNS